MQPPQDSPPDVDVLRKLTLHRLDSVVLLVGVGVPCIYTSLATPCPADRSSGRALNDSVPPAVRRFAHHLPVEGLEQQLQQLPIALLSSYSPSRLCFATGPDRRMGFWLYSSSSRCADAGDSREPTAMWRFRAPCSVSQLTTYLLPSISPLDVSPVRVIVAVRRQFRVRGLLHNQFRSVLRLYLPPPAMIQPHTAAPRQSAPYHPDCSALCPVNLR